jgi:hypothetical protein
MVFEIFIIEQAKELCATAVNFFLKYKDFCSPPFLKSKKMGN